MGIILLTSSSFYLIYVSCFQAQESYEKAMEKARKEHERSNVSPAIFPEYQLWEDHWIRCERFLISESHLSNKLAESAEHKILVDLTLNTLPYLNILYMIDE